MTVRPRLFPTIALAILVAGAAALPRVGLAANLPVRSPAEDAKLLEILFPGDRETEARTRTAPPGLRAVNPSGWAAITAAYSAKVVSRLIASTVVEYQTFEDPSDESATSLGLAVIHRGAVRWRSPLVEVRGRDSTGRPNSSAQSLHKGSPDAILWSFDYSRTSMTVKQSIRLFHIFLWTGSDMAELLSESAAIRHGADATDVALKVRDPDRAGWRVIELATLEPGPGGRLQTRTKFFTHQGNAYAESGTMESATSRALRLLRPVPKFDGTGWPSTAGLPVLAILSSSEYIVQGRAGWKGPKAFSAWVLGGAWQDGLLLVFRVTDATPVFFSTAPNYGGGDSTQRELRRTDRIELVFREREGGRTVRLVLSPGNLSNVTPFASQIQPDFEAAAPGVEVRARRTERGYDLLVLLEPDVFGRRLSLADALVCFSVIDVRESAKPSEDTVLLTAEKFSAANPATWNPVTR